MTTKPTPSDVVSGCDLLGMSPQLVGDSNILDKHSLPGAKLQKNNSSSSSSISSLPGLKRGPTSKSACGGAGEGRIRNGTALRNKGNQSLSRQPLRKIAPGRVRDDFRYLYIFVMVVCLFVPCIFFSSLSDIILAHFTSQLS